MIERFKFVNNKVVGTIGSYEFFFINKTAVRKTKSMSLSRMNTWQTETLKLLKKTYGKNKKYIENKYKV